ncbi:MAG: hypothetical protein QF704_06860 [Anaerolineales bacterium]|nr:hypothetical protein [Anaerolineales bacterium]
MNAFLAPMAVLTVSIIGATSVLQACILESQGVVWRTVVSETICKLISVINAVFLDVLIASDKIFV